MTESDAGTRAADAIAGSWTDNAAAWQQIVCNVSLPGDPLHSLLGALRSRLAPGGQLLVQTVHPWSVRGEAPFRNGWRMESFEAFAVAFPTAMPRCYRTVSSWVEQLRLAGRRLVRRDEPLHPSTHLPLSLLLHCEVA